MSGGLLSLVAQGAQDAYLTGSPQITFFRIVYCRYTNFALEAIEQTFNGAADFGRRVTATISRNGDLVTTMYLQVTLPALTSTTTHTELRYINSVGHALMRNVEVEIGGQKIDKIPSEYMEIFHQLSMPEEKRKGYEEMVGQPSNSDTVPSSNRTTADTALLNLNHSTTLYIPLFFWFNRVLGNALPLIALQYHEIKELIWTCTPSASASADPVAGNMWFDGGEQNSGTDLMTTGKILLNGHDRFQERAAPYFRLVQPYQHHTRIPS
ncbi:hypothetical protein KFL_008090050 [Klebsormidium nitens]|uniref:Major capsid protein N-terminal domain-containing protein n=1 Tax=Klebsormidium nitens TaxID=105231 RepID=A0A1Y1IL96_KLENI|nr:hypothetical protein KFL_008090050 [Klebsormidium nitens]|eukprot:GAQ91574.1 hypothetical protein KFL_008090050 [Klebsormidium nitens]